MDVKNYGYLKEFQEININLKYFKHFDHLLLKLKYIKNNNLNFNYLLKSSLNKIKNYSKI